MQDQILSVDRSGEGLDRGSSPSPHMGKGCEFFLFHPLYNFFCCTFFCIWNVIVRVVILTEDQVDNFVSVEKERWTQIFFACCGKWCKEMMLVMAMLWSYIKKVLTTMLIMFLISQLLIKATYFFYRFNYLVSDLMLLVCNNRSYLLVSTWGRCITAKVLLQRCMHKLKSCL